jgi:hypothetical protein
MLLGYIFIGLFLIVGVFCLIYVNKYRTSKIIISDNENRIEALEASLKQEIVKISHRIGFYDGHYTLTENEKSWKYSFRVYVTELEKYANGYSKFAFDKVNMMGGYSKENYGHIIHCATNDFLEVQETKNITFLDRDINICEIRKDKLERILKNE